MSFKVIGVGDNTWFTPKKFIDILGPFDLDPCSTSFRPFDTAKEIIEHDKGQCGLSIEWKGDIWLNPPYGREIKPFIKKFIEHKKGVLLIFARMDSSHVQDLIQSGAYFYFLKQRINFIDREGKINKQNGGTGSVLIFYDTIYIKKIKFFTGMLMKLNYDQ